MFGLNKIYNMDCLKGMKLMDNESVDLIYLDPPFFTQKDFINYSDKWKDLQTYLDYMKERLVECQRILKNTGSIYLHCDSTASHYLKVVMDTVFGGENFQNEIVWCYRTGGASKKRFGKKHDTILFYSKTKTFKFNTQHVPYVMGGILTDEKGPYQIQGGKRVDFNPKGALMPDWWEISYISSVSKERLGYPTQKPIALLERIIKASSNEGDIVLDPFMGSGTTVAVAKKLGRNFIGMDINQESFDVVSKRLRKTDGPMNHYSWDECFE